MKRNFLLSCAVLAFVALPCSAQCLTWTVSTKDTGCYGQDTARTVVQSASLFRSAAHAPLLSLTGEEKGVPFRGWGCTFNELDWDALSMLTRTEQDELLEAMWAPNGDLRFNRGRISMGANDYARSWYSCDEVAGDFDPDEMELAAHSFNTFQEK